MASFTTDGKLCIERELEIDIKEQQIEDLITQFDIIETCRWIAANRFRRVCLQFPDELLGVSTKIYEEIKNRVEIDLYILADTTYASCCVDTNAALHVQGHALVHYGHICFTQMDIPIFIVLPKKQLDIENTMKLLHDRFPEDNNTKLCLYYDNAYQDYTESITKHWFEYYPQSYITNLDLSMMSNTHFGRVVTNKDNEELTVDVLKDCICIYIGSRGQTLFNYTVSIAALEWYSLDPNTNQIEHSEETAWIKRRRFLVEKCKDAKVVGILVCKLAGDETKTIIRDLKNLCKVCGKKNYIVSVGKPNVQKLANYPEIDVYVMIACPENDLYNARDFYRPIVYPYELEVALNANRDPYFTTHCTDYADLLYKRRYYCAIKPHKATTDVSLITGRIRNNNLDPHEGCSTDLAERQNWALESIGQNLQDRSWRGLEQRLGETEIKEAEPGRSGLPLQYSNEPQ